MSCSESSWLRGGAAVACLALEAIFCAHPATAETMNEALANAYLINPVLSSERARLRATDEQVSVAISGLRPFITASGDAAFQNTDGNVASVGGPPPMCTAAEQSTEPAFCAFLAGQASAASASASSNEGVTHPRGYSVTLTQPIFEGFQNLNAIR